ncbi:MAG: hypothetical protein IJL03_07345 [Lachnospiraceae bacterium]|nr:hypothetical protein [Lachnospiraceae bacterium]
MSEKELGEALNAIYELEKERYQTMRLNEELTEKVSRYAIPKKIAPVPGFQPRKDIGIRFAKAFAIFGAVLGVVSFYLFIKALDEPDLPAILIVLLSFAGWILWTAVCALGFGWLGGLIDTHLYRKAVAKERQTWELETAPKAEAYRAAVEADAARVFDEKIKIVKINKEQWDLRNLEKKEAETLAELYEKAGIGADYRRLIPMRYMANFFNLGISRKLEGTDGLYYLVRQELRADQFNASLKEISAKMDTVIGRQSEIYRELCAIEEKNREMIRELEKGLSSVPGSVSTAAAGINKRVESSVSRYVGTCIDRQSGMLYLASHWGH